MDNPILTIEEREASNSGRWFSTPSPSLPHDLLRCAYLRPYKDGELTTARGKPPREWIACARGAVRVSIAAPAREARIRQLCGRVEDLNTLPLWARLAKEREEAIRIEPGGLVIRDREALMTISAADK